MQVTLSSSDLDVRNQTGWDEFFGYSGKVVEITKFQKFLRVAKYAKIVTICDHQLKFISVGVRQLKFTKIDTRLDEFSITNSFHFINGGSSV